MPKLKRRRSTSKRRRKISPGVAPGTLTVPLDAQAPNMTLLAYGPDKPLLEVEVCDLASVLAERHHQVLWLNINGLADLELIRSLGDAFGLHTLALEDVVQAHQRPKVESYGEVLFLVLYICRQGAEMEQLSLFLGKNFVLTFQERTGDCFDPVRQRIRQASSRLRASGPDYLAYCLVDTVIDHFFPLLEAHEDALEGLEAEIFDRADKVTMQRLQDVRRELRALRRPLMPLRDVVRGLLRDDTGLITENTTLFLRDCADHANQLAESLDSLREHSSQLTDSYLSFISHQMNEVMKVLTIIATLFMPLGFIAGLYGMNFDREQSPWNMPELGWYWGYPMALGLMLAISLGLIWFFRRRGWF